MLKDQRSEAEKRGHAMEEQGPYKTEKEKHLASECPEPVKVISIFLAASYWTAVYQERDRLQIEIAKEKANETARTEWFKFIVQAESVWSELQNIE